MSTGEEIVMASEGQTTLPLSSSGEGDQEPPAESSIEAVSNEAPKEPATEVQILPSQDVNKENENTLLPKVGSKRTFATKSTGHKRRKLSPAPPSENQLPTPSVDAGLDLPKYEQPAESEPVQQPQPVQPPLSVQPQPSSDPYLQVQEFAGAEEMALPAETFASDNNMPEWMAKDKKKDEYLDEPFPQPYHDPSKPPVEGFPTTGFPAPLPGGMGHPYSLNYQVPQISAGQLTGGFGSSDPNLAENASEPVQGYKWVECAFCLKWRKIPAEVNDVEIPQPWSCAENIWDNFHATCNAPQEDDGEVEESPFTLEEMNAPLPVPPQEAMAAGYQYSYDPSRYDPHGYQGMDPDEWEPEDERPMRGRRGPPRSRTRSRPTNTVSLSNLLDNSEGVDPQYAKERKEFYQNLEGFLQRPPDVNLLCGAPVDLYQLFTETTGRGGYEQVCTSKQWREIFRQLPQYSQTHTSASYALKKMYRKNLLEYENAQRSGLV